MLTATDLAAAVRAGELDPVAVTECALARILSGDGAIGAFRRVRTEEAVVEARALRERPDFAELPLAGVPIAIKDVTAVAGEYVGWGSRAASRQPVDSDSDIRAEGFFAQHDVLITPVLATMPPKAQQWSRKGWLANAVPSIRLTTFLGPWDLAGFPAISIPAGRHPSGLPIRRPTGSTSRRGTSAVGPCSPT